MITTTLTTVRSTINVRAPAAISPEAATIVGKRGEKWVCQFSQLALLIS
jgi:hypothetical protein